MDAMSNILLQRYQQQANLLSGFALSSQLNKTATAGKSVMQGIQQTTGLQSLTGVQQTQTGNQLSPLSTGGSLMTISAMGRQMNEFSRALGNDSEARSGLRAFALEMGKNQLGAEGISTMNDLRTMQIKNSDTFRSAFVTAGQIKTAGGSVTSFLQTLANQPTSETQSALNKSISETMTMNGTANERKQVASSILATVSDIQKNTTGETETGVMTDFLSKLATTNTLSARSEFITIYRRKEQSIFAS